MRHRLLPTAAMTLLAAFALLIGNSVRACAAEESFLDLAQDGSGRFWALREQRFAGDLLILKGEEWVNQLFGQPERARPLRLLALRDGSMACLWIWKTFDREIGSPPPPPLFALTRHRGDEPPVTTYFRGGPSGDPHLLERRDGSLVAFGGTMVVLIPREGEARVLEIPRELFADGAPPEDSGRTYAQLCAIEDGTQRLWLWSYALDPTWRIQLRTFVTVEDGRVVARPVSGLEPDTGVSDVVSVDDGHLWYARTGQGIFELDLKTLGSRLVSEPLPETNGSDNVQYIEQLFCVGGDRFAITSPRPAKTEAREVTVEVPGTFFLSEHEFYDQRRPSGRLLGYREGKWEELLAGLDLEHRSGWRERPHLMTASGLLVASHQSGPWLVLRPEGKPPVRHGWETNFPLRGTAMLFTAGEHTFRALTDDAKSGTAPIVPAGDIPPTPIQKFLYGDPPVSDVRGVLWTFRDDGFSRWDGRAWQRAVVPEKLKQLGAPSRWWGDDHDSGWSLWGDGPVAVCHFATGAWDVFDSWEKALEAQLPIGARLEAMNLPYLTPVFSGYGQVAFIRLTDGLHFFDGKQWRQWELSKIGGAQSSLEAAPYFNEKRQLSIILDGQLYEWEAPQGPWKFTPLPDPTSAAAKGVVLPAGCALTEATSSVQDSLGTFWITSREGRLFKAVSGLTVPVLAEDEPNPFRYGEVLEKVLIDSQGGAMIQVPRWSFSYSYYHLPAKLPLPKTSAKLLEASGESARVHLGGDAANGDDFWYAWRLDAGPWQPVRKGGEFLLSKLAAGPHRLQVRAYNAELGADRTPVVLEWTTGKVAGEPAVRAPR